jgi:hypothetical protein
LFGIHSSLALVCKKMDSVNCPALLTTFDFTALQQYLPKPMAQRLPHLTQLQTLCLCCQEDEDTTKTLLKLTTLKNLKHLSIAIQDFTIDSIEELFARLSNLQVVKSIMQRCQGRQ